MSDPIVHVSDATFEAEVLKSDLPVLVDYWAEWCGPCKQIAPILNEIAEKYANRVKVVKLNIDDNSATTSKYAVRGIPTLILFRGGDVVATRIGSLTKGELGTFLDSNL